MQGFELDKHLNEGYFRMQQDMFTCDYLFMDDDIHPVIWLRYRIGTMRFGTKQRALLRKCKHFRVESAFFENTTEEKALYAKYLGRVDFEASPTVDHFIHGEDGIPEENPFDTRCIKVYDGVRLIAVGIFDQGISTIAGIMNFFDPEYASYSLGKYLLLCKIIYAANHGMRYYYPGYISSSHPKFNYKTWPDEESCEILDKFNRVWVDYSTERVNDLGDWLYVLAVKKYPQFKPDPNFTDDQAMFN